MLERKKLLAEEKLETSGKPIKSFRELFELAMRFLSNPYKIWENGNFTMRRMVLRMAFVERITYCPDKGVRTPKIALPFNALRKICAKKSKWWSQGESNP